MPISSRSSEDNSKFCLGNDPGEIQRCFWAARRVSREATGHFLLKFLLRFSNIEPI
jgi:hypothetical protein